MSTGEKVLVACMRDEALFVIEWVAHHLVIGFDRIVVYTNDCHDGTDKLLKALSKHAPVEHYDNPGPYEAGTIQKQALHEAMKLPQVSDAEWVMHIDADEYLNVEVGKRQIDDLLSLYPKADVIAVLWRHFGSAGLKIWDGGSVIDRFTRCEDKLPDPEEGGFSAVKSIFRPQKFKMISAHTPKLPIGDQPVVAVNTVGTALDPHPMMQKRGSGFRLARENVTWENASLHHHHVKSDDLHLVKFSRGDANGRKNAKRVIGSEYYKKADRNDVECTTMLAYRPAAREIEAEFRAHSEIKEIEDSALAWFSRNFQKGSPI
ncbi:MAG: glycosyltransferase family 2 protein [Marivivens sp.]